MLMRISLFPVITLASLTVVQGASGQIRADEVLVVYDSRLTATGMGGTGFPSRDVAEYYAGSRVVPGGVGGLPGARRGVRVFDLATSGVAATTGPNITWTDFSDKLRSPIRSYLTSSGLSRHIRAIVMTKGLPHRILDTDAGDVMDFPGNVGNEYTAGDMTAASVDTELMLLWQTINLNENGGNADSRSDGVIINPYWKSAASIATFSNVNNEAVKTITLGSANGPVWAAGGTSGTPARLTPGDLYLVARLDGNTVEDVRAIIDRAQNIYVNVNTTSVLLDESESNGIADFTANTEFDNSSGAFSGLRDADDYEVARDAFINDRRWAAAQVRYNAATGFNQFFIGPRVSWQSNHGIPVSDPVMLVASYGLNHLGQPLTSAGVNGGQVYATSYNYVNGAVFSSLESFNCRGFGGLAPLSFAPQQQASAFFAAGGTFAVGNVWEPLADSVPDIRYIAQNFILGNVSFVEAAWSSVPALSWMQVAVGDPLARVQRSSEDVNSDGAVTVDDVYAWERTPVDVNRNSVIDAADRLFILRAIRAAERTGTFTPR
jgi:hypothetical protein